MEPKKTATLSYLSAVNYTSLTVYDDTRSQKGTETAKKIIAEIKEKKLSW